MGFLEVYIDYEDKKIGFKPIKGGITGFKIQLKSKNKKNPAIYTTKLNKNLPKGVYDAERDRSGLIVIKVPEIASII